MTDEEDHMVTPVRLAIIGYGLATGAVIGPLTKGDNYHVVGCADSDELSRERFTERFGQPVFESAEALFDATEIDAVYIATPTRLHERLVQLAVERGAHVLVEKPIATRLDEAERMVAAAKAAGKVLMVNHKRSADRDVLGMWQLTKNGDLGKIRAVQRMHYSDWFYRARAEDERDPEGGGVVLRQGAHEFDMLRQLMPAVPVSLRGWTTDYGGDRPGEGAYYAWMECADGTILSSTYSGYDFFRTEEFSIGPMDPEIFGSSRRNLREVSAEAEHDLKRTVGHPRAEGADSGVYGWTLMNCEAGDLRPAPGGGVYLYDEQGRHELKAMGPTGTEIIVNEFHDAITTGAGALHDGSWGLACMELCMAVRDSSESGREISLTRQGELSREVAERVIGDRTMQRL